MRYMILIHSDESHYETVSEQQMGQLMADYGKYSTDLAEAGVLRASDRLQPVATATTVRIRKGETMTTDGPFAETKEQFGGYYLIDVADLDEAIKWAARCPTATYGSIEVRPIWEYPEGEA